jgi:hypothetical protein
MWVVALPRIADGGSPDVEAVREWIVAEAESAATGFAKLEGCAFHFTEETSYVLAPGEIARLRAEVGSSLTHPKRAMLGAVDRQSIEGPDITRYALWMRDADSWRINIDTRLIGDDGQTLRETWNDVACTPRHGFALSPDQLNVTGSGRDTEYVAMGRWRSLYRANISLLLSGGVWRLREQADTFADLRQEANVWSCIAKRPGLIRRFRGIWSSELKRGFVTDITTVQCDGAPEAVGHTIRFGAWQFQDLSGQWIATHADIGPVGASPRRVVRFVRLEQVPASAMNDALRVPAVETMDPIRGALTFRRIVDDRSDRRIATDLGPDGEQSRVSERPSETWAKLRVVGWVTAASLLTASVVIRVLRGKSRVV